MKAWIRPALAAVVMLVVAACSRVAPEIVDPSLNDANSAKIFLYRTSQSFHSLNPEQPYFYLNDEQIGSMGTGGTLYRQVPVGTYRISVRKPILFMPAYETGAISITAEAGKVYYIRYSLDPTGLIGTNFTSSSSLAIVDDSFFRSRR
jgi:hypothetical protein